jgi:hypothetical protein
MRERKSPRMESQWVDVQGKWLKKKEHGKNFK